ncbi:MAG TPA: hypothetical protein VKA46_27800 [Gemmataceae bacterium]|nr:hypothetical protein [Gemmataceae bacterium]
MRRIILTVLPVLSLLAPACDDYRGPRLAMATNPGGTAAAVRAPGGAPVARKGPTVYGGKTADQWAQLLQGHNREEAVEAARALHVLGREGREHLFRGLDCPHCETRRLCLETLTIADFKKMSEPGRQKLVALAGDRDDVRIRERAAFLLTQWHGSIPAP